MSEGCSSRTERNPASASSVRPIRSCSLAIHSRASTSVGSWATICSNRSSASTVRPDRASCSARLRSVDGDWHAMDRTSAVARGTSMRKLVAAGDPAPVAELQEAGQSKRRDVSSRQLVLRPGLQGRRDAGAERHAIGVATESRDRLRSPRVLARCSNLLHGVSGLKHVCHGTAETVATAARDCAGPVRGICLSRSLAGRPLRGARLFEAVRLCRSRGPDAGARHWRHHRDFQRRLRCVVEASAFSRARAAGEPATNRAARRRHESRPLARI